ncbi:MAG: hypothetical protein ACU84J_00540 [Gammaproteobacteria bacterium]
MENKPVPTFKGVIAHCTRYVEKIQNDKVIIESTEPYNVWLKSITLMRMAESNVYPPISFLYERSVIDEIGAYREDLPVLGDWEFNLRFIVKYDIGVIKEELAYYHHRLSIKEGGLGNSLIMNEDKHKLYDCLLRNELLRSDIENNQVGIGYLVGVGESLGYVKAQMRPFELISNGLRSIGWLRKITKNLKKASCQ